MSGADELAGLIAQFTGEDGMHPTPIPRLTLIRMSRPTDPLPDLHEPAACLVVQGAKQVMVGQQTFVYDRAKHLVVSVDVPIVSHVTLASREAPYLCVRLDLDPVAIAALLLEAGQPPAATARGVGIGLGASTPELMDAAARLVRLLNNPDDAPFLAPLAEREILYRLLQGEQGARLRDIASPDSRLAHVNRAISWIKLNFDQPFSMQVLAEEARMSPSALHEHFKAITALSPLQYQKQLRLQQARRLILGGQLDAAGAGHQVGYESPSQFSREYARLFGDPPIRDAARLRAAPDASYA
ncbi:AraC family transcriptional regulator [Phenylobacterium sp. Root77]|uniref:AraC family transcriptional regulator n=1 Tax=unclassified Phenylobacterium TaxID=2640670 RepID=UPI0006F2EF7B|nr:MULTISPECIES: AraC family transcriptional regulator [unclassified Phenylobacterium]KQW69326.1 AraC family transcriptional regulator [Phenylobacterium sp. Root1277]KQW95308.1 AraC family transcriptional regulator [Phenylobacterium sp. Root1290]KRC41099.1 AraC family transcriptional regulator [Phenylobacterium sp. Root77]